MRAEVVNGRRLWWFYPTPLGGGKSKRTRASSNNLLAGSQGRNCVHLGMHEHQIAKSA